LKQSKKMYALCSKNAPVALVNYLNQPHIQSLGFDPSRKMYCDADGRYYGGLLSKLQRMYYPYWERKRKSYRRKGKTVTRKASSAAEGKAVDKQLTEYVRSGKRPRSNMARAIIAYFEESAGQRIVAAQVPLYALQGTRVTQADLIVANPDGSLIMIEVKCGYNRTQKQGDLKGLPGVACRQNEIWELQRHYTHKGLVESGLPLIGSHVLNVYKEGKNGITVKRRQVPKWALEKLK
jgi:hypothetical protein